MEPIKNYIQKELIWTQPSAFKEEYELRSDDAQLGTVAFRSSWGTLAAVEAASGCWTFKRVGFFSTRVTIRRCDSEKELASFRNNTWSGGGTLELANGRVFRATTNFWQTKLELVTEQDDVILHYSDIGGFFRRSANLVIEPVAAMIPDLDWVVLLSWYLVVMMYRDSASAATAVIATSG